jgi:outer membrane protein TolC
MVLSGFSLQRVFSSAVLTILFLVSSVALRGSEAVNVAGTMPEDYLPDLKRILAHARQQNPEMIVREYERVMAEARLIVAKSARLPSLGGNFDYGVSQTAISSDNSSKSRSTGAQYNFSAGQALFHWGAIKNEIEISKLNLRVGSKDTERILRDISNALRRAYLALIVQKVRVNASRASVALVREDVRVAEVRKEDGMISPASYEGEKLRLRDAELSLNRLTQQFETDRKNFGRVAGLPERVIAEEAIPNDIPRPVYDEALAAAIAAKTLRENARGTIEWEIYDMRLQEALLRQKIVGTRLLPKFGLGASFGQRNNTSVNGTSVNQEAVTEQRIAVSGSWAIFDGLATRGFKREAAASRRLLEQRQKATVEELMQTVQQLERSLRLDAEHLDLADIRHGIAVTGQNIVKEGVELGNLPRADLQRSEVTRLGAYAGSLEARAQYLGRWAEFVATAGVETQDNPLTDRNARK